MNKNLFICLKFLSWIPFFRATDDSNFGDMKRNSIIVNLRFSLISFNLGKRIYHFITLKNLTLKPFYVLNLDNVSKYDSIIESNGDMYDQYKVEIYTKENHNPVPEKEYLLHKITQIETSRNKTFNKFLAYIAIFALILPLYGSKITNISQYINTYKIIFLIVLIYIFINFSLFLYAFISVKKIKRTRFRSIRNSQNPSIELNSSLYYELLNLETESTYFVTIIKNIEKYIISFIVWSLLILVILNGEEFFKKMDSDNELNVNQRNNLISFQITTNFNDFIKTNNSGLMEIQDGLLKNKYEKIIVVTNLEKNNISSKLLTLLELYNNSNTEIIEIHDEVKNDNIELILLEEK